MTGDARQVEVDRTLAREALEKAGLAAGNARDAEARVAAALSVVQEILSRLTAAGDLDLAALEALERRLAAAEAELSDQELFTTLNELRDYRVEIDRQVGLRPVASKRKGRWARQSATTGDQPATGEQSPPDISPPLCGEPPNRAAS